MALRLILTWLYIYAVSRTGTDVLRLGALLGAVVGATEGAGTNDGAPVVLRDFRYTRLLIERVQGAPPGWPLEDADAELLRWEARRTGAQAVAIAASAIADLLEARVGGARIHVTLAFEAAVRAHAWLALAEQTGAAPDVSGAVEMGHHEAARRWTLAVALHELGRYPFAAEADACAVLPVDPPDDDAARERERGRVDGQVTSAPDLNDAYPWEDAERCPACGAPPGETCSTGCTSERDAEVAR
ncbi:hypothetical protein [Sorangium sp. So ce385]|uniref:hypothetical protein n=1 Tax=Sorangium sp. So ce385 TaxID=3133308 RepID=UPI003F5BE730